MTKQLSALADTAIEKERAVAKSLKVVVQTIQYTNELRRLLCNKVMVTEAAREGFLELDRGEQEGRAKKIRKGN